MDRLETLCKALRVGNLAQFIDAVEFRDKKQFLADVLDMALQHREDRRMERFIKQARFPALRTFEGYEFDPITFPKGIDKDRLLSLEFIDRRENILCIGVVGTGKTHLAIALGPRLARRARRYASFGR